MISYGTSHFVSRAAALRYFRELGGYQVVNQKLRDGEITIGRPQCRQGETLTVNSEGRYVKNVKESKAC